MTVLRIAERCETRSDAQSIGRRVETWLVEADHKKGKKKERRCLKGEVLLVAMEKCTRKVQMLSRLEIGGPTDAEAELPGIGSSACRSQA